MKKNDTEINASRRSLLKSGATIAVIGAVAATGLLKSSPARAQTKASKATMMYMDKPHGKDQCDNCIHFVPGKTATSDGTCKIVDGSIGPTAWCVAYARKA